VRKKTPASVAVSFRLPYEKHLEFSEEARYYDNMSALVISKLETCERAEEIFRQKNEENYRLKRQVTELEERLAKSIAKSDGVQSKINELQARNEQLLGLNRFLEGLEDNKKALTEELKEANEKYLEAKQRLACIHEIISPRHEKKAVFTSKTFHQEVVESLWKFSDLKAATKASLEGKIIHFKSLE
jgi:DNA repair exonuclease SbcCD ATPase subunit